MVPVDEGEMTALYNEPKTLVHAFKCTGQVGLTALQWFDTLIVAEFEQAGIGREMDGSPRPECFDGSRTPVIETEVMPATRRPLALR